MITLELLNREPEAHQKNVNLHCWREKEERETENGLVELFRS